MRSVVASHGPASNPRGNATCNAILLQCFRFYRSSVFNILDRHCPPSSDVLPLNLKEISRHDITGASPGDGRHHEKTRAAQRPRTAATSAALLSTSCAKGGAQQAGHHRDNRTASARQEEQLRNPVASTSRPTTGEPAASISSPAGQPVASTSRPPADVPVASYSDPDARDRATSFNS
ncbi:hypothetical protein F511_23767 [Dorcoceras hygrometricum]|uniref:Uncharacterized protein n=1 Tax=Dorcoceras hygrometricum TaxID=472368 RepID=A0A2Z7BDD1_9LAMI|nr:hypothetical protein F511_23767 [Dorcoceras hygrometricum]